MDNSGARETPADGALNVVARTVGRALGTIASLVTAHHDTPHIMEVSSQAPAGQVLKLAKKHKSRVPRRLKKIQQKTAVA